MSKYKIYTGKNLSEEMYLKTWELDNRTFEAKDRIPKSLALDWFYASKRSTIVLWDTEKNKLIGYITPFLLSHDFAVEYINSDLNYKEAIKKEYFPEIKNGTSADLYIFSIVVYPAYRDKVLDISTKTSKFNNKTATKILTEALVDYLVHVKEKGVSINYVFAEKVSNDGEKYLRSLKMQPCFALKKDAKFAKLFTPDMFYKCDNVDKLYQLYTKENACKPYDKSILKGHEYLSIKNNYLYYKDIKLIDLVKKYNAPLEVAYTPMITEKVEYLKNLFAEKLKTCKNKFKYHYAYATKANYYSEVILTALKSVDMLETSSAYDIDIIVELYRQGRIKKGFTVICNGFKNEKYVRSIDYLLNAGINVIPVIENSREYNLIAKLNHKNINVGLRYNSDFESRLIKNNFKKEDEFDNRFGFVKDDILKYADLISKSGNLTLQVLHFHFGGTISNIDNYIKGFSNIFELYCELKSKYPTLKYFDFGGGFPVKYSLTYRFDYDILAEKMVKTIDSLSSHYNIQAPDIIGEHGRFTAADHSFYIYKIDFTKEENGKFWYIINGSLMNMTPDMWGIQQDFTILPLNLLENDCVPVCLGGETCDPDDRYFLQDKNVKLFMPKIKEGQELYIGVFSIGAYQEIISGIGGVHHCLIPEGYELIIYKDHKNKIQYYQPEMEEQTEKVLKILDYSNKNYVKKF